MPRTATPPLPIIPQGTALKMKPIDQINSWMQEALRPYFGLAPLSPEWDVITVRDGYFICDDAFLRGNYAYMGSKMLAEEDILFPVGYGSSISAQKSDYRLSWGPCSINKDSQDTVFRAGRSYMNNGAYSSVSAECFAGSGFPDYDKTLHNPSHREAWEQVLAEFDFPPDTTYDAFALRTGGLTRAAYLAYVADNKAYQRKVRAKKKEAK
ncbi:hypothetical protein NAL19_2500 [Pectobacterium sp. F1-1]|nr:hypothetical protein NAL19_2500 [Pectobacterium sp. F1-1]